MVCLVRQIGQSYYKGGEREKSESFPLTSPTHFGVWASMLLKIKGHRAKVKENLGVCLLPPKDSKSLEWLTITYIACMFIWICVYVCVCRSHNLKNIYYHSSSITHSQRTLLQKFLSRLFEVVTCICVEIMPINSQELILHAASLNYNTYCNDFSSRSQEQGPFRTQQRYNLKSLPLANSYFSIYFFHICSLVSTWPIHPSIPVMLTQLPYQSPLLQSNLPCLSPKFKPKLQISNFAFYGINMCVCVWIIRNFLLV